MQQKPSSLPTIITILLVIALAFVMIPKDTLAFFLGNAKANVDTIASAMPSPIPSPTTTPMAVPSELGPQTTDVVPPAQATAGIPTIEATPKLLLEDLPPWGTEPDMMKYREAMAASSKVNEMSTLVLGGRSACFVGENRDQVVNYDFKPPFLISAGLNLAGINLPDTMSLNFDSSVHTSSTVCGTVLFGARMDDIVNTSTVTGNGIWESTGTAGKRISPTTGEEEMFQLFEQAADFESQPTICIVGVHVNGQIVNTTYDQPGAIYRAYFPVDMGNQFAIDFAKAWEQFTQPANTQPGAEIARTSLVSGQAHAAMCAFLDLVDGGATRLNSCVFTPRIPTDIQYCGNLDIPPISTSTP